VFFTELTQINFFADDKDLTLLAPDPNSTPITFSKPLDKATGGAHEGDTAFYGIYGDRVEYIYFPLGQIPPAGPYQVGVYGSDDSRWTVTVEWYGSELDTVVKEEASMEFEVSIPLLVLPVVI
jgi:hypothetical protein